MGIRGFTTFVDGNNTRLLQDHNLHSTRVVIDGNNFYHFLYQYLHVKHCYGGDYDVFYKKVKDIFHIFEECDIKPFVVFDGGYDTDGKKLKTTLSRAKNRIHLAGFISHGGRGKIMPILAYETFKTVLDDMGVPYVVCDFEADTQIVKLANHWQCPVMSNDSDFCVFDLKGGFILFDYVDFRLVSPTDPDSGKTFYCMSVQLYHIDNFAKEFPGFDKALLPVVAVLLGNDFIESSLFENFFSSLKSACFKSLPQKHRRLVAILDWCEDFRSWEEAVEKILTYVPKESRESTRLNIHRCIRIYTDLEESFSLSDFFDSDTETSLHQRTDEIKTYNGSQFPSWFISAHRSGAIHSFCLNTVALHRNFLLTQVEKLNVASAYSTSERIRQVAYGILLKDDSCAHIDNQSGASMATNVLEYTRDENKNLKKTLLEPISSLPSFGQLPGLSELADISNGQRVDLILEALSVPKPFLESWSPSLQLLACVIVFWVSQSRPKVTRHHYHAILVCVILLQSKSRIRQLKQDSRHYKQETDDDISNSSSTSLSDPYTQSKHSCQEAAPTAVPICVKSACEKATESQLTQFLQNVDKHHAKFAPVTHASPVDASITHGSSQLQACLFDCLHLNQLLQGPLEHPQPHQFFSGVFLYNFTKELRSRSKPLAYIYDILVPKSPMSAVFAQMESLFSEHIGQDCFQETGTGKKNSKKKGKKKGDKKKGDKKKKVDYAKSDVCSENSDSDLPEMVQAACEVDNRFSCLLIDH